MKWFKHDSAANNDAKLKKVRIKYGMEGYGLYWYCLELIAGDVSATKITFELEHDAEIIAHDTGIHYERVNEMMAYMTNVGLFQQGENGIISCIKMAQRIDQSMTSNPDMRKVISKLKLNNHDSIMTPSAKPMQDKTRLDEIRIDKNIKPLVAVAPVDSWLIAFEFFWNTYDKKEGRHKCELKFKKLTIPDRNTLFHALPLYIQSTPDKQYRKNPLTWLNGKHWNDEITTTVNQSPDLSSTDWAGDKVFDPTYLER